MPETVYQCPLCGDSRSAFFEQRIFRGQMVTNRLCLRCGLVYQSPRMTASEAEAFYAQEYRVLYEGSVEPTRRNLADQRGRAESLLAFTKPLITTITKHLDIGCSVGVLLQHFQEIYSCQSFGIEPNEAHRDIARKAGLAVYASLNELEAAEPGRFDLISMIHVLEHLPDPVGYLVQAREHLLTPEGWLLVEVPNLYAHDAFEIAHLVSYSTHSLEQVLTKAGFKVVKSEQHGRPRSLLLPLYISLLAHPSAASDNEFVLQPEKQVAFKRKFGMLRRYIIERLLPHQAWIASSD